MPSRLYRQVAEQLADLITGEQYSLGDRLPTERQLAALFKVSRPTVREAVIALEGRGLVEVRQGAGMFIVRKRPLRMADSLDDGEEPDVFSVMEARIVVESATAGIASTTASDAGLVALKELTQAIKAGSGKAEELERAFHSRVAELSGNHHLARQITAFDRLMIRAGIISYFAVCDSAREHAARQNGYATICTAIETRKPLEAQRAMRDHLIRFQDCILLVKERAHLELIKGQCMARREEIARRLEMTSARA